MKIDRLLSIVMYLLNRELVSARELAEHYEVSIRTIQRDMDALTFAGIPVHSSPGSHGGYGIMPSYKLDRQLINTDDLFFILTSLEAISNTFKNRQMGETLEKIKSLVRDFQAQEIARRQQSMYIDFSALGLYGCHLENYRMIEKAIAENRIITFEYHSSRIEKTERHVEPMTLTFCWFSWYLFGYCHLREAYRLFRISRMRNVQIQDQYFNRREMTFSQFKETLYQEDKSDWLNITLKFHPDMAVFIEDHFTEAKTERDEQGYLILNLHMPEENYLHSMILGYGDNVEVLAPESLRETIYQKSLAMTKIYSE